jgi:hypothetical protein
VVVAGVSKLKGIGGNRGRGALCLGEDDVEQVLLDCLETRNWKAKVYNEK